MFAGSLAALPVLMFLLVKRKAALPALPVIGACILVFLAAGKALGVF